MKKLWALPAILEARSAMRHGQRGYGDVLLGVPRDSMNLLTQT